VGIIEQIDRTESIGIIVRTKTIQRAEEGQGKSIEKL
jgi:hypothetical protein